MNTRSRSSSAPDPELNLADDDLEETDDDPIFRSASVEGGLCRLELPAAGTLDDAVAPRHR